MKLLRPEEKQKTLDSVLTISNKRKERDIKLSLISVHLDALFN
jgi:hypothetical protein